MGVDESLPPAYLPLPRCLLIPLRLPPPRLHSCGGMQVAMATCDQLFLSNSLDFFKCHGVNRLVLLG